MTDETSNNDINTDEASVENPLQNQQFLTGNGLIGLAVMLSISGLIVGCLGHMWGWIMLTAGLVLSVVGVVIVRRGLARAGVTLTDAVNAQNVLVGDTVGRLKDAKHVSKEDIRRAREEADAEWNALTPEEQNARIRELNS